jgi:hypothetical protein
MLASAERCLPSHKVTKLDVIVDKLLQQTLGNRGVLIGNLLTHGMGWEDSPSARGSKPAAGDWPPNVRHHRHCPRAIVLDNLRKGSRRKLVFGVVQGFSKRGARQES